jgi:tRNA pseudouridine55 synthase
VLIVAPMTSQPQADLGAASSRTPPVTGATRAGLIYVDKPVGLSSHDVVAIVRRAARSKRVGHAGTLDPFATGLLVLAVGSCTRLLPYIVGEPKVYDATIRFGHETDTDDATGTPTREQAPPHPDWLCLPHADAREHAMARLTGTIAQIPPAFSAKHVDGQRAYELARRGRDVQLAPVNVTVHKWEWLAGTPTSMDVRITCGGGTYIRALARDLGRLVGSAAHCETLRRVASGPAHVRDAVTRDVLVPGAIADGHVALRSPLESLGDVAHQRLEADQLADLRHGRPLRATEPGTMAALLDGPRIVAMATRTATDKWQPKVVLLGTEE